MYSFINAKPVWAAGREKEINLTCVFKGKFQGKQPVKFSITASCLYRLYINGELCGYGPARAAHGYFRVDEYYVESLLEENQIMIEVAGYNTISFYTLNQPSFLCCEVIRNGQCILATNVNDDFLCFESTRLQKVAKFSYQRAFTEYYVEKDVNQLPMAIVDGGKYLERGVDFADMTDMLFGLAEGGFAVKNEEKEIRLFEFLNYEKQKIYQLEELERFPIRDICQYEYFLGNAEKRIKSGQYGVWCSPTSETGFIGLSLTVNKPSKVYVIFDEVDSNDHQEAGKPIDIVFTRNTTYNVIGYEFAEGKREVLSFEIYTAKYIKIIVEEGDIEIDKVLIKTFRHSFFKKFSYREKDEKIALIFEAAARTFAQNAVDILMDCPSRERAGWLCDGYFSGRAERYFTGDNKVERNFLENYALAPKLQNIPNNMIPMCYPSDIEKEMFIPNWAMWYIVELYDYFLRTDDKDLIEKSRFKVEGLLKYFESFENEFGLLENLENWVFIEWSKANDDDFIKGVNFPSNMLYAYMLECVSKLYSDYKYLEEKGVSLKKIINEISFNGKFYEDNAVRNNGKLTLLGHTTETCQYYAFYFHVATTKNRPELFRILIDKFGPLRDCQKEYPDVYPSNAFIGNYLRLEILLRHGLKDMLKKESIDYFYGMARTTGTLWEHNVTCASLNHGFASYIAVLLSECW